MKDRTEEYSQALLNISTSAQTRLDKSLYEGYFEKDLEKLKELIDELEHLPTEIGFKDENDIFRLKAFIKEELRRNKILAHMVDRAILILVQNQVCPKEANCSFKREDRTQPNGQDPVECYECWNKILKILGTQDAEDLPFK